MNEKDIIWEENQTKEVYNNFYAENFSLALTGSHLAWIKRHKPEILDYVLVKGNCNRLRGSHFQIQASKYLKFS